MKTFRKIFLIFLAIFIVFSVNVFADDEVQDLFDDEASQAELLDDPLAYEANYGIQTLAVGTGTQENVSDIISRFDDGSAVIGIDVSEYNGDIDWATVANSGVKFAIIRCAYRGVLSGTLYEDAKFRQNIEGAINNGIYVGVYYASQSISEQEAIDEANYTINLISGYDVKFFVSYDFETFYSNQTSYRAYGQSLEQVNKNASAFLNRIREAGYTASLYSNVDCIKNRFDMNMLSSFDVWVANWRVSKPSYSRYNMWQYTDNGVVPGIQGAVDVDIDYTYYFIHNNIDITPYMFNSDFYAARYQDVRKAFGYDAKKLKEHYLNNGIKEGRAGSPIFDPEYYRDRYSDVRNAYGNNFTEIYNHFVTFGAKEGRQGSKFLDTNYYLKYNGDVKRALYSSATKAIEHFYNNGIKEERLASPEFVISNYKVTVDGFYRNHLGNNNFKYMALASGGEPVDMSNVDIRPYMFDANYYYNKYEDIRRVVGSDPNALRKHFEEYGKAEGRSPSPIFDAHYYLEAYPDLKKAFGDNYAAAYEHFINNGAAEGRGGSAEFQVEKYLANYQDVRDEYGKYFTRAIEHYVLLGKNEGRVGN